MSGGSNISRNGDHVGALAKMLREAQIEWPPDENSYFIPVDKIRELEKKELVREELRGIFPIMGSDELDHYVEVIRSEATKIFAVLLCSAGIQGEICKLIGEGVADSDLPLVRVHGVRKKRRSASYTLAKKEHGRCKVHGFCQVEGHAECGIKALSSWDRMEVQNLCRDQWLTLSPIFKACPQEVPHYDFDDAVILPFIEDEEKNKLLHGGYSEVWGVRIHPAHQEILISSNTSV
jgi:hypothetical protein